MRRAFTLIELLVVVSIIALLAAILLPVFFSVRGKARQTACVSNLRQIGLAISLYAQDADDLYPYGNDPSDTDTNPNIWATSPYAAIAPKLLPLRDILQLNRTWRVGHLTALYPEQRTLALPVGQRLHRARHQCGQRQRYPAEWHTDSVYGVPDVLPVPD